LADKLKIPAKKLAEDLGSGNLSDNYIMKKYGLNFRQLIFAMGKLAERRMISFKRIVAMIRKYLDENELKKAEICIRIVQNCFVGVYGIQTALKGLERDLLKLKSRIEFRKTMDEKSKSLIWFESEYPGVSLHPAIASSVKVLDYFMEKKPGNIKVDTPKITSYDACSRLKLYPDHIDLFNRQSFTGSTRIWHQISLHLFYQRNVKYFTIRAVMDAATRDVCMHLDGTRLPVKPVLLKIFEKNRLAKVPKLIHFPMLIDVENLPTEQKIEVLMNNEWYLPPFCENCRCQIFPS
jgi:hypothetical protein